MTEQQVIELMMSSKNSEEWNDNADKVKSSCGGYPSFWFNAIMMSGLAHQIQSSWSKPTEEWANELSNDLFPKSGDVKTIRIYPLTPDEIDKWMNK